MIPTVIVVAALVGRWWAIPAAGVLWPLILMVTKDDPPTSGTLARAAALGVLNGGVGIGLRKMIDWSVRSVWHAWRGAGGG